MKDINAAPVGIYMNNIENYDRVTAILSPFSGIDMINPEVLNNAANRGTLVHSIIDCMIDGIGYENALNELSEKYDAKGYIDSFLQWNEGKEFIEKPARWFCDQWMITGECDSLYKNETGLTLVDFKTPASEGKTWNLQASAYHYLGCKAALHITKIEFVRLKKNGKFPSIHTYEHNFDDYLKCLYVYRTFYKNRKYEINEDYL